jgi:hypothetical protein
LTTFRRANAEALREAQALREQYVPIQPLSRRVVEPIPVELDVTVRNPLLEALSIGFELDGAFAGEEPFVPRRPAVALGALAAVAGERSLGIQIHGPGVFFHFVGRVHVPPAPAPLIVDVWSALYPPRIVLADEWINPPPGLRWQAKSTAPCPGAGDCALSVIDRDQRPGDLEQEGPEDLLAGLDLWIDGHRIFRFEPATLYGTTPVLHRALLSPGLHRVRIGDPRRRRLLLDSDVLLDPASDTAIEIAERRTVAIRRGADVLLEADAHERPFQQGAVLADELPDPKREVEGIPIPKGIEGYFDDVGAEAEFNRAMAKNYQEFKDKKEAVNRKKQQHQPLTQEEQAIDAIDGTKALNEWVKAKKKAERGWDLTEVGTTDPDNGVVYKGPPPTNPMDELRKRETLDIHEPSHLADCDVLAVLYGVDLKKLRRLMELRRKWREAIEKWIAAAKKAQADGTKPPPMPNLLPTPEQEGLERWYKANKKSIDDFYKAWDDPIAAAQSEVREYLAGADFWDAVLQYLKGKSYGWVVTDMALNIKVGETKPIIVQQMPNAPPRVRVIEGAANIEVSPTEQTSSSPIAGGFRIKVKGQTKGPVKIELTCGTLRKVVVINVV